MSLRSPATDAFIARLYGERTAPQLLVRIAVTVPSALTLNFAFDPVRTPDGTGWHAALLDVDPISAPGGLLEPGPSLCSFGFKVANARMVPQAAGTLCDLLNAYQFEGATVTVWLWEAGLVSFSDALQRFKGVIQGGTVRDQSSLCRQRK